MGAETTIQTEIRRALAGKCILFRYNTGRFKLEDGRWFDCGPPVGHSDLAGVMPNGRAVFIECKTATGKVRPEQVAFLEAMRKTGAIAGVCRSASEALALLENTA